ncbi:MAG TPA: LemA family protein [Chthoniobacteraceae bacterium]|jgi:LemA protein|nr:LemA family protein [Chthoniobacteraceae bacterium]
MAKYALGCFGIIVLCVVVLLIGGCSSYNGLVRLSQDVDSKWADVQADYQRRMDLIPNLVNTVSGAANFEKSTLIAVTNARASVGQVRIDPNKAPDDPQKLAAYEQAQAQLGGALSRLLVVAENYPNLKSSGNFLGLQAELEGTENRIAVARMNFNHSTQAYDTAIRSFPAVLYAGAMGFSPKPYFESTNGAEKAPSVHFNFGGATPSPAQ